MSRETYTKVGKILGDELGQMNYWLKPTVLGSDKMRKALLVTIEYIEKLILDATGTPYEAMSRALATEIYNRMMNELDICGGRLATWEGKP